MMLLIYFLHIRPIPNMSMNFGSNRRGKPKNSGLTAAIGLCIAAICLVAAATVINTRSGVGKTDFISGYTSDETSASWAGIEAEQPEVYIDAPLDGAVGGYPDVYETADGIDTQDIALPNEAAEEPPVIEDAAEAYAQPLDFAEEDDAVAVAAKIRFNMPLTGTVMKDFSGENLVYCPTMCDWRVHQGVDITGEADCEVRAAADGIVVDFVEDMLYGYTAIIRQEDESMLYYCGLTSVPSVTAGLEVHAGDVIGHLGVVPCEASDPPHLHLAIMRNGVFSDPMMAMGL